MSHRIIVMNQGRVAQIDTPAGIYERPADLFVADFVGASNLVPIMLKAGAATLDGTHWVEVDPRGLPDGEAVLGIRPETLEFGASEGDANALPYRLAGASYLGSRALYLVELGGHSLRVETDSSREVPAQGWLRLPRKHLRVFAKPAG